MLMEIINFVLCVMDMLYVVVKCYIIGFVKMVILVNYLFGMRCRKGVMSIFEYVIYCIYLN